MALCGQVHTYLRFVGAIAVLYPGHFVLLQLSCFAFSCLLITLRTCLYRCRLEYCRSLLMVLLTSPSRAAYGGMEQKISFETFFKAILILFTLAMSFLSVVACFSGWVAMGVPFRSGYPYWDGRWFRPSCTSFCRAIAAIFISVSSCNALDLPLLASFSLGFPVSLDQSR